MERKHGDKKRMSLPAMKRSELKERDKSREREEGREGSPKQEKPRRKSMIDIFFRKSRTMKSEKADKKGFRLLGTREENESKRWKAHESAVKRDETKKWVIESSRRHRGTTSNSDDDHDRHVTFSGAEETDSDGEKPDKKNTAKSTWKNTSKDKKQDSKQKIDRESAERHKDVPPVPEGPEVSESEESEDEDVSPENDSEDEDTSDGDESQLDYGSENIQIKEGVQIHGGTMAKYKKKERYYIATPDAIIRTIKIKKPPKIPPPNSEGDFPDDFPRNYSGKQYTTRV